MLYTPPPASIAIWLNKVACIEVLLTMLETIYSLIYLIIIMSFCDVAICYVTASI